MAKRFFIENITENKQGISPSLSLKLSSYSKKEGTYFLVELPTYIWIGNSFSMTVTAKNADGTTDKQYKGDCTITENGAGDITPITIASTEWENGVVIKALIYLTLDLTETTLVITVTDNDKPWIMGSGKTNLTNLPQGYLKIILNNELYYDSHVTPHENIYVVNKDWIKRKTIPKGSEETIGGFVNYYGIIYYTLAYDAGKGSLYKLINDEPVICHDADEEMVSEWIGKIDNDMYLGKMAAIVGEGSKKRLYLLQYRAGKKAWIDTGQEGYRGAAWNPEWITFNNEIFCLLHQDIGKRIYRITSEGNFIYDNVSASGNWRIPDIWVHNGNLYVILAWDQAFGTYTTYYLKKRTGVGVWTELTNWTVHHYGGPYPDEFVYHPLITYKNKLWATRSSRTLPTALVWSDDEGVNFTYYKNWTTNISEDPVIARTFGINGYNHKQKGIDFNDCLVGNIRTRKEVEAPIDTLGVQIEGEP